MKKICFSNPTILMKRPVAQISQLLSKELKVSVLAPRKAFHKLDNSSHYSSLKDVKVIDYPTVSFPLVSEFPIPGIRFIIRSWKALKNNDIIHMWVPFYKSNSWIALMKLLFFRKKRLILTMDTIPGYSFSMGSFWNILFKIYYRTFGKIVFAAADKITLYGKSLVPCALKAGIPKKKIVITPTGIDSRTKNKNKDIKAEFGIKKDENVALYVGLLVPRKGIDLIIKTANRLRDEKIRFILVGEGPLKKRYKAKVKELGLNNIIFTGSRRDVHNFYSAADIFFFPSRGEGLAGVLMEAMIYKVPVISSNIPCTPDLIEDKKNGLLCNTEDSACYAREIKRLLADKDLADKFKEQSLKRIRLFNWSDSLKSFLRLY